MAMAEMRALWELQAKTSEPPGVLSGALNLARDYVE